MYVIDAVGMDVAVDIHIAAILLHLMTVVSVTVKAFSAATDVVSAGCIVNTVSIQATVTQNTTRLGLNVRFAIASIASVSLMATALIRSVCVVAIRIVMTFICILATLVDIATLLSSALKSWLTDAAKSVLQRNAIGIGITVG